MQDKMGRRRSVDVGGLALAVMDQGHGHGWGGWEETDCGETGCVHRAVCTTRAPSSMLINSRVRRRYAEVLIDVRLHTETIVSQECDPMYVFLRM